MEPPAAAKGLSTSGSTAAVPPKAANGIDIRAANGGVKQRTSAASKNTPAPVSEIPTESPAEPTTESTAEPASEPATEPVSEPAQEQTPSSPNANDASGLEALFDLDAISSMDIYDLGNYTFGKKERESRCYAMQGHSSAMVSDRLSSRYAQRGLRRSVAAVLLVHVHRFPHVLLLQRADSRGGCELPGGRLRLGESDEDGLARKLRAKLMPDVRLGEEEIPELDIGERLSTWYRIDFSRQFYPYIPAHVTKPKEEMHVYSVSLPEKFAFSVPKNMEIVAIPLYDVFDNSSTFGSVIASLPALTSRFHKNYC